jgi:hypothetical protein
VQKAGSDVDGDIEWTVEGETLVIDVTGEWTA